MLAGWVALALHARVAYQACRPAKCAVPDELAIAKNCRLDDHRLIFHAVTGSLISCVIVTCNHMVLVNKQREMGNSLGTLGVCSCVWFGRCHIGPDVRGLVWVRAFM